MRDKLEAMILHEHKTHGLVFTADLMDLIREHFGNEVTEVSAVVVLDCLTRVVGPLMSTFPKEIQADTMAAFAEQSMRCAIQFTNHRARAKK